jgi:hypothetical protein
MLMGYDIMLLSCTGESEEGKSDAQCQNVHAFADAGGRIFGSHWHHGWVHPEQCPYPATAVEEVDGMIDYSGGAHGFDPPTRLIPVQVDTSFPKGAAFAEWLVNVGASTTAGQINLQAAEHSVDGVLNGAQRWIYGTDPDRSTNMVQHLSFNTPVGGMECGRMVCTTDRTLGTARNIRFRAAARRRTSCRKTTRSSSCCSTFRRACSPTARRPSRRRLPIPEFLLRRTAVHRPRRRRLRRRLRRPCADGSRHHPVRTMLPRACDCRRVETPSDISSQQFGFPMKKFKSRPHERVAETCFERVPGPCRLRRSPMLFPRRS